MKYLFLSSLFLISQGLFAEIIIIQHPGLGLSASDAKDAFMGDKESQGSTKITPADNKSIKDTFISKFLGIDSAKYESNWTKKSFRNGSNPPPVKGSDAEVMDFVKSNPGGIGYVHAAGAGVDQVTKVAE